MRKWLVLIMAGMLVLGFATVAFSECYYFLEGTGDNSIQGDLGPEVWNEFPANMLRPPEYGTQDEPIVVGNGQFYPDEQNPYVHVLKEDDERLYCNPTCENPFIVDMNFSAYVHQWLLVYVHYVDWYWEVWKPGWYATDSCWWVIRSNAPFKINFSLQDFLYKPEGVEYAPENAPDLGYDKIELYADYGTDCENDPNPGEIILSEDPYSDVYVRPASWLNSYTEHVNKNYTDGGKTEYRWIPGGWWLAKWWFIVHVDAYNEPGNYSNTGTITVTSDI